MYTWCVLTDFHDACVALLCQFECESKGIVLRNPELSHGIRDSSASFQVCPTCCTALEPPRYASVLHPAQVTTGTSRGHGGDPKNSSATGLRGQPSAHRRWNDPATRKDMSISGHTSAPNRSTPRLFIQSLSSPFLYKSHITRCSWS